MSPSAITAKAATEMTMEELCALSPAEVRAVGSAQTAEWDAMHSGNLYFGGDPTLTTLRSRVLELSNQYASVFHRDDARRKELMSQILGTSDGTATMVPPFFFDYGVNMHVGKWFFANAFCSFLDGCPITIGDNVLLGPNVQMYTASHPLDPVARRAAQLRSIAATLQLPGLTPDGVVQLLTEADQQRVLLRSALATVGHEHNSTLPNLQTMAGRLEQYFGMLRVIDAIAQSNDSRIDASVKFEWRGRGSHSPNVSTSTSAVEPSPVIIATASNTPGSPSSATLRHLSTLPMCEKMESGPIAAEMAFVLAAWANIHCCIAHLSAPAPHVIKHAADAGRQSSTDAAALNEAIHSLQIAVGILEYLCDMVSSQPWRSTALVLTLAFVRIWTGVVQADLSHLLLLAHVAKSAPLVDVICGLLGTVDAYRTLVRNIRRLAPVNTTAIAHASTGVPLDPVYQAVLRYCEQAADFTQVNALLLRATAQPANLLRSVSHSKTKDLAQLNVYERSAVIQTAHALTSKYSAGIPVATSAVSAPTDQTEFTAALSALHDVVKRQKSSLQDIIRSSDYAGIVPRTIDNLLPATRGLSSSNTVESPSLQSDWVIRFCIGYAASNTAKTDSDADGSPRRRRHRRHATPLQTAVAPSSSTTTSSSPALRRSNSGRSSSTSRSHRNERSSSSSPPSDITSLSSLHLDDSSSIHARSSVSASF
ncbi:hypothetical protein GQ42DRAFT_163694 [Ramicandelaber brevisporus]|nr:hypothetical protein GQ42DRAFT_163694 [Ramicandelaber brevisporus]